jgi:galactose mutarotase-like enzyme
MADHAKYGAIFQIADPESGTALQVAPDFFGHLTSLQVGGQEFLYPPRGSWFMFPWAGILHAPDKKVRLPDGTIMDLSARQDLAWKPHDRVGHGYSRLPIPFAVSELDLVSGAKALRLQLNTSEIQGLPSYYRDLKVERFFVVQDRAVWIFTRIHNLRDEETLLSFGDHHVFNLPHRDRWKADPIPAARKWNVDALGLPTQVAFVQAEPKFDFRSGKSLCDADYDVALTGLDAHSKVDRKPNWTLPFADFSALMDRPCATSRLIGPNGEIIQLDQDVSVYRHIVFWTPQANGQAASFVGLEPQTSVPNILPLSGHPDAAPVVLKPGQVITTWHRIAISPALPDAPVL